MKNYKDNTIEQLCTLINYLEDQGCLLEDDSTTYRAIIQEYETQKQEEDLAEGKTIGNYCLVLRDTEDGEVRVKNYKEEEQHDMMREACKIICFGDIDNTWEILTIIYQGREVKYCGWQPKMLFTFNFKDTNDLAWQGRFPAWEH